MNKGSVVKITNDNRNGKKIYLKGTKAGKKEINST